MEKSNEKVGASEARFSPPLLLAVFCVISGLAILIFVFFPILWIELNYAVKSNRKPVSAKNATESATLKPTSTDFGIVIPKIHANAPIVKNVNAFASREYQQSLAKGIAHARGTSTPDKAGNTFLFAHSAENWLNANRYNAIFYLLYKLEKGDGFSVFYEGREYIYKIEEKRTVDAEDVEVMNSSSYARSVTLMTCWPPGTTFKRLILVGSLQSVK